MTTFLDRMLGDTDGSPLEPLDVTLAGAAVPCNRVGPITIRRGRADPSSTPTAAVCGLSIAAADDDSPPYLGDPLTVDLGPAALALWFPGGGPAAAAAAPRFRGKVTDVTARLAATGPYRYVYQVTAVSNRSILGRLYVGDEPWDLEPAAFRAYRILELVDAQEAITWAVVGGGDNEMFVLERDVDRRLALELLDELAEDASALLVDLRGGAFAWQTDGYRSAFTSALTLDAGEVIAPAEWVLDQSGVVTDLEVLYGLGDPRPSLRQVVGPDAEYYPVTSAARIDGQLADEADAQALLDRTLDRWAHPRWRLDGLGVDVLRRGPDGALVLEIAKAATLFGLEQSALVLVDGFPLAGPFATRRLWLEGWTETITATRWRFALDVSDFAGSASPPTWADLTATGMTWADLTATGMTWADLANPSLTP